MIVAGWNCPGLGRLRAVHALKDLVMSQRLAILGLIKTKMSSDDWAYLRVVLGYDNCFAVNRCCLLGGLALFWNSNVDLSVVSYSRFHIDSWV